MTSNATPRFSVFTPSHRPSFLDECLATLQAQSCSDWEWIVLLNNGARWRPERPDERVRVEIADDVRGVGAAKRRACELACGEILVELDHDDLLARDCLAEIGKAFDEHPDVVFVYSNTAQITEDGGRDDSRFNETYGWKYEEVDVDGRRLLAAKTMAPTPHNVSYIWYAPNHVRSFRRDVYEKVGGYDATRTVLDDQDMMSRLFQAGDFHHIERCLYLQRMHGANTQRDKEINAHIQRETVALYDKYIEANALAWTQRRGLVALDLGAAHRKPPGYLGVDQHPGDGVDFVATLPDRLDLPDASVGLIRAVDFLEHVPAKVPLINELYRLLAPGGMLLTMTPSSDGRGAYQDPTHVAFYNENSFWYYTDNQYRAFVPEIEARFQSSRLVTYFPTEWHSANNISYVVANLIAMKEGAVRNGGPLLV
ncbi:glycosyltransferase [Streptomyces sp. MI02-2A]|uniref:glycosyltransferase n=1 Tax=unclassified Streptomyces TaxID=2593676 RepID=UPI0007412B1E|nr:MULTISPECIES: glycosyltransferase [unclassified Streptomyces]KUJ36356.1 glycosyl transferase family 2 [Streptomyces sp. NRRL F-5122]MDX3257874.1 glycosyltransferase [Streptomyces sp. MI02-2A]REE60526.1 methyltransferase family protein [Streptomyces sp. 3212.3]